MEEKGFQSQYSAFKRIKARIASQAKNR